MLTKVRFGSTHLLRFLPFSSLSVFIAVLVVSFGLPGYLRSQAKSSPEKSPHPQSALLPVEQPEAPERAIDQQPEIGIVEIDGRKILSVYQAIGSITAKDRAEKITERILEAAKNGTSPDSVMLTARPMWTEISAGGKILLAVSDDDAKIAGTARAQLAEEDAEGVRQALANYSRDHNWRTLIRGSIYSVLATLVLLLLIFGVIKLRRLIHDFLERSLEKRSRLKRTALQIAGTYVVSTVMALGSVMRWLVLIALFEAYITVVLSFFPQTRSFSHAVTGWVMTALQGLGAAALAYLPNLFIIAVVITIASQVSRLISMVFDELARGNLSIRGFYPEWAGPTAKLIRLMVLVLVVIIIFPYLPGSKSPAFQGISIFVGVLLSLGSSSAVANAIAGIILTYMRSFLVGDWVKIGETIGEVTEKNMLVTRILTQKHEIITIPNATVMSGSVMNYTREAKNSGVIFYTTVTIGYDAPWKTVHQLLIDAACATEHVLSNPAPFVLQSQLNDFYVAYELNVHTDNPRRMQFIYSDLHQNIQDRFNEAGVEICSPHFAALRDGNSIAIPTHYIPRDYAAPGFRVNVKEKAGEASSTR
jgi:small-conductance mechanosensitive channel